MKKFFKGIFKSFVVDLAVVVVFLVGAGLYILFGGPEIASANSYTPLAEIPGFTTASGPQALGQYINSIYKLSIALGSVLAVLMLVVGGLQYMSTDIVSGKSDGKTRINNAIGGLGLLLVSFLILQTINPELIDLNVEIKEAKSKGFSGEAFTVGGSQKEWCVVEGRSTRATTKVCHSSESECEAALEGTTDSGCQASVAIEVIGEDGVVAPSSSTEHNKNVDDGFSRIRDAECSAEKVTDQNNLGKAMGGSATECEIERKDRELKGGRFTEFRSCVTRVTESGVGDTFAISCYYHKKK